MRLSGSQMRVGAVGTLLMLIAVTTVAAGEPSESAGGYCATVLEPVREGETESRVVESKCFNTASDVLEYATGAPIELKPGMTAENIREAIHAAQSSRGEGAARLATTIGVDWEHANYQGLMKVWIANNSYGCLNNHFYAEPTLSATWNDRISSSIYDGGCLNYQHYEHSNYGGGYITCSDCPTMGYFNDRTSSEIWLP